MAFLFTRPNYDESHDYVKLLTDAPLLLIVFAFMTNRNGIKWHPIFLWGILWEEFLLRYIPFQFMAKNIKNSIVAGVLFTMYYGFSKNILYMFICFTIGTVNALAERKYSIVEMILYRVVFTMWIYD